MENISIFGILLAFFGAPVAVFSFLIFSSVPLTVFGFACAIVGGTILLTPWGGVPEPPVRAMVEGSCINIEVLLEELDDKEKGIYLPPNQGKVFTYVPLTDNPDLSSLEGFEKGSTRMIAQTSGSSGLFVFPPGSELIKHSEISKDLGLEGSLHHVLVDFLEAVDSVRTLKENNTVSIYLENPRIETTFPRFESVLGSLPTSVGGSVIAFSLNRPVRLVSEERSDGKIKAQFELIGDEQE